MKGFVFLCGERTEKECLDRLLFGTSDPATYEKFRALEPGDYVFLYNYDLGRMRGPFLAVTPCSPDIEPHAWSDSRRGGFPYQVRVDDSQEFERPLTADDIASFIPLTGTRLQPPAALNEDQIRELLRQFQLKSDDTTPIQQRGYDPVGYSYIFRCNRETGAKSFDEDVMGAPAAAFRPVVSKVRPGDRVFLWVLDERHLYGVWTATARGQYSPGAFGDSGHNFPAVVFCERWLNLPTGIDEASLRKIVPFDGALPPYRVTAAQSERLIQELARANGADEAPRPTPVVEGIRALDGHVVKSRGECMIDDFLFQRGIVHAYDHLLSIAGSPVRCDFFVPGSHCYIEFWGLSGNPDYDRRRDEKLALYRQGGLRLIEIFPSDLSALDERLFELF